MSSTVDWSKAPEGTTHLYQSRYLTYWMRQVSYGTGWEFWNDGVWEKDANPLTEFHIPRPTEPQEPTPWNGEGLPPVGTVCEFYCGSGYVNWRKGTIFAIKTNANGRVDALIDFGDDWSFSHSPDAFRPYKSDEQIAAEERSAAIDEMVSVWRRTMGRFAVEERGLAEMLYDAGYRKVEQP